MTLTSLQIIILVMSLLDLTATYFYISTFHAKFPTLDYTVLEANPIIKQAITHFGIGKGMLLGGLLVFGIVLLLVFSISDKWKMFFLGALSMMLIYHWQNFMQLRVIA